VLPLPSPADMFLDIEANLYVLDEGLEYLIGMLTIRGDSDGETRYGSLWAFTRAEEKKAY
jgi:predicted RecB family nuclease